MPKPCPGRLAARVPADFARRPAHDPRGWDALSVRQFQRLLNTVNGSDEAWTYDERQRHVRQVFDPLERKWAGQLADVEREVITLLDAGDERGRDVLAAFTRGPRRLQCPDR
jgi:hypothetical protein